MNKLPLERELGILIKKEESTNKEQGKRPEERNIEEALDFGIINLNKPSGPSSHQVSDYVKKSLDIARAGHSGTLDPKVTGVLPIALNRGTRVLKFLLTAGKEYVCLMHLHKEAKESEIRKSMKKFVGEIRQKPPVRSAVKRVERTREVYYLDILEIDGQDVLYKVGCAAGTYIRTLCVHIGRELGMGAHMAQLVRTKVANFDDSDFVSLHDVKDAYEFYKEGDWEKLKKIIRPIEEAVSHLPKVWISDNAVESLCHGADLNMPGIVKLNEGIENGELIAVMTLKDELIGVGIASLDSKEMMKKKRGLAVKTSKVFMERGTYSRDSS